MHCVLLNSVFLRRILLHLFYYERCRMAGAASAPGYSDRLGNGGPFRHDGGDHLDAPQKIAQAKEEIWTPQHYPWHIAGIPEPRAGTILDDNREPTLITHQWIETGRLALIIFSIGSGAGAFLCLFIYAKSARYVKKKLDLSTQVINTSIAILFFAFAAYHIVKQLYLHVFRH